jgi:outer membrane protein TolC
LNQGRSFDGTVTTPQNQAAAALSVGMPVLAPALWAQHAQARDEVHVAELSAADVRRQVAVATAQAYLAIFTRRRVFEATVRARDTARAHYDLAHQQRVAGSGSLLNELRAQQTLDADQVLVEQVSLAVYLAQEALGVLVAATGPVDAAAEPVFEVPQSLPESDEALLDARSDVRLANAREAAALRVWRDSWKDWFPTAQALFQPQYVVPETIFQPSASWRAQLTFALPVFDGGYRRALRTERQATYNETDLQRAAVVRQARSDVRTASAGVSSADRALASARTAAAEARHVLDIVNVSFKVGAATEIEVIDAQRALLDAETSVAVAEDVTWQARLALLVAIGRFP